MKYIKIVMIILVFVFIGYFYKVIDNNKIKNYSNERPREDIISKMEVYNGVKADIKKNYIHILLENLKEYPEWKTAKIGDIILVEDFATVHKEENPYYYYVNAKLPNGEVIAQGIVWAMTYEPEVGCLASGTFANKEIIPIKMISKKKALELSKKVFNLKSEEEILLKAVVMTESGISSRRQWKWAVKTDKMIKVNTSIGVVESNQFLINPKIYLRDNMKKQKNVALAENEGRFSVLNIDVFGDRKNMERLSNKTDRNSMLVKSFEIVEENKAN